MYTIYLKHDKPGTIRNQTLASILVNSNPLNIAFAYIQYSRRKQIYSKLDYSLENIKPFTMSEKDDNLKIIIIIGESARSNNFSLNGYYRNTNPKLKEIKNIISFHNVRSCDTSTKSGIHCIMNGPHAKNTTLNLIPILQSLEFETTIFSLQNYRDIYRSWNIDHITTKYELIARSTTKVYDNILVEKLRKTYSKSIGKQVFILHTLGSHAIYGDRYPKEFEKFTPVCKHSNPASCNLKHLINEYDNTIIFTDHIIAETINIIKNDNAILFYISDHGESLGEKGVFTHAMPKKKAPPEQFQIPFIIWVSDKFADKNPELLNTIR